MGMHITRDAKESRTRHKAMAPKYFERLKANFKDAISRVPELQQLVGDLNDRGNCFRIFK